ncbi:MAG TPA: glycosyltransferase family 4 protein [Alphaproteobacteria bacterium]|nr:glycosyltransferase family 4 protein [Alphaproteobacteria bacterium]
MKVLHFYKVFFPDNFGGVEKVIDQISIGAADLGIESEVLCLTPQKNESLIEMNGYKVHRVPQLLEIASTPFSTKIFKHFAQLAKDADIIHYHFPWPFADVVHFATRVHKPTLITYHSDIVKQKGLLKFYKPLMNRFLSDTNCIVATSPNYVTSSAELSKYSSKVRVIPIGLNKDSYPEPTSERLKYWKNKFKDNFFLFIGVMRYYKGLHTLIEAAKGIDAPIVIIGSGEPIEQELKVQVQQLGLNNIHFLGPVAEEDKVALLRLCYGVVLPSHLRSEAFGISLLEGAMYGKPMISCEIGTGTTYINIHKETGIVVPPGDSFRLQEAMQFLLERPKEAKIMGLQAEKRYRTHFTAEKMVRSYVDIYEGLLK